jgi:hypothetical protein
MWVIESFSGRLRSLWCVLAFTLGIMVFYLLELLDGSARKIIGSDFVASAAIVAIVVLLNVDSRRF